MKIVMREIKFRGFNRKNNVWLYGFYLQNRGAHFVCPDEFAHGKSWDDYEVDPDTLGQYTGLQDDNGNDMYEGDIIQVFSQLYNGNCYIGVHNAQFAIFVADKGYLLGYFRGEAPHRHIIGNIHDNPELLEEEYVIRKQSKA